MYNMGHVYIHFYYNVSHLVTQFVLCQADDESRVRPKSKPANPEPNTPSQTVSPPNGDAEKIQYRNKVSIITLFQGGDFFFFAFQLYFYNT